MSKNRQILTAACIVAILLALWVSQRESSQLKEREVGTEPTLSSRSPGSTRRGENSGTARRGGRSRQSELLQKYKLLWQDLDNRNASTQERTELARQTAGEFMFSDQMAHLLRFIQERRIRTGKPSLFGQLALLFRSNLAHEARISLLSHLDNLEKFNNRRSILELSGSGLNEEGFNDFYKELYELNPKYSGAVLFGRDIRQMATEPATAIESRPVRSQVRAIAYIAAAAQWTRTDPNQAFFLANQIQDDLHRKEAIRRVEGVLFEMRMSPEDR